MSVAEMTDSRSLAHFVVQPCLVVCLVSGGSPEFPYLGKALSAGSIEQIKISSENQNYLIVQESIIDLLQNHSLYSDSVYTIKISDMILHAQ